ncbi:MAG: MotA/TolQ/ExbB proton channel family protein [Nitrosomonas sp.]|nr:MotA/TolQ/ExbB proton channel family protein [Nitrosomonas sp.]
MENGLGFSHFLAQIDQVGTSVLILLLSLSVASWYLIISKSISNLVATKRANLFLENFWKLNSLQELQLNIKNLPNDNAFSELAKQAIETTRNSQKVGLEKIATSGTNELLTRTLRNGLEQEATRIEGGLTIIASAGSAAPYIGLFGTVWGIYHALIQIGLSGQGTLDKVAGPVGEALIMTALGLAVAIPAVLAYNAFTRRNRIWMSKLDAFAHDLYTIITVDNQSNKQPEAITQAQPRSFSAAVNTPVFEVKQ